MADSKVQANTKRKPPNAGKGRPKGSKNKTTAIAKDAIEAAAQGLGGAARIVKWAQEDPANERVFWSQMYTKLLPLQVKADVDVTTQTKEQRDAAVSAALRADS